VDICPRPPTVNETPESTPAAKLTRNAIRAALFCNRCALDAQFIVRPAALYPQAAVTAGGFESNHGGGGIYCGN
jgi:hypothetical protein